MKKKSTWFYLLSPNNLATEVDRFGYEFSLKNYLKWLLAGGGGLLALCALFKLKLLLWVVLWGFAACLLPFVIYNLYKGMYEEKRFADVTNYLEQILYSFRRRPKILEALDDTLQLFPEGTMREQIIKVKENLWNKTSEDGNIYNMAFGEMEAFYGCRRMGVIHQFFIRVEENGGAYEMSVDLLAEERRLWVERVYELQKERKNINIKITISIVLSLLVCFVTTLMLPGEFKSLEKLPCQIGAVVLLVSDMLLWYFAQKKLSPDWLGEDTEDKERITGAFARIKKNKMKRQAKKYICREADKAFPVWMMEMSLYLQTENPRVALAKSSEKAPLVFREGLQKLVEEIERNPASIEPYLNFMPEYELPEVRSALRLIYSLAELGTKEMEGQLQNLARRNNRLMDKAERLKDEDRLAGSGMLMLLPMLNGSFKMMVDLGVFLVALLNMSKTV